MMILGEYHLWTLSNQICIPETDIGCYTYREKGERGTDQFFSEEKEHYAKSRDIMWLIKNKRPERLKDCLKELEALLITFKCIFSQWMSRNFLQLILNNGILISIIINTRTSDIEKIIIDRFLVGKLISENIVDIVLCDNFMILSFYESKLNFIWFNKKLSTSEYQKKWFKLSLLDPKINVVELPSSSVRRLERHLSLSSLQDLLLVWWSTSNEEAWPWTPVSNDRDRANLVVYGVNRSQLELITYARTECEPLLATFSLFQTNIILTVEQSPVGQRNINIDACTYDVTKTRILQVSSTTIPLKTKVNTCSWNPSEDKLLLGCDDTTLILYDSHRHITLVVKAAILPNVISWHPGGTLFFVSNSCGQFQCFDMALSSVNINLLSENLLPVATLDLNFYFRFKSPNLLQQMKICPFENQNEPLDIILFIFEKGPLSVLQLNVGVMSKESFSPFQLVSEYIRLKKIDEAVNLLASINWNLDGVSAFRCLHMIADYLLRLSLTAEREVQLETALGCFYSPSRPLSDIMILEYRDSINCLARRFFHHLLRFQRFDKAFLLAVDIGAKDLFMDIYHVAKDKKELTLADAAREKALQIDSQSTDSDMLEKIPIENIASEESNEEEVVNKHSTNISQEHYKLSPSAVKVLPDFSQNLRSRTPIYSSSEEIVSSLPYSQSLAISSAEIQSFPQLPSSHAVSATLGEAFSVPQSLSAKTVSSSIEALSITQRSNLHQVSKPSSKTVVSQSSYQPERTFLTKHYSSSYSQSKPHTISSSEIMTSSPINSITFLPSFKVEDSSHHDSFSLNNPSAFHHNSGSTRYSADDTIPKQYLYMHPNKRDHTPQINEQFVDSDDVLTEEVLLKQFTNSLFEESLGLQELEDEEEQDADGNCRTVKVVHFGIV